MFVRLLSLGKPNGMVDLPRSVQKSEDWFPSGLKGIGLEGFFQQLIDLFLTKEEKSLTDF